MVLDFINVGYGDAILLRDKRSGFTMLVDCGDLDIGVGPAASRRMDAADFLAHEQVSCVDLLVLTHLHLDHVGGLCKLIAQVEVKEVWANYLPPKGTPVEFPPFVGERLCDADNLQVSLRGYWEALKVLRARGTRISVPPALGNHSLSEALSVRVDPAPNTLLARQAEALHAFFLPPHETSQLNTLDTFINDTSLRLTLYYNGFCISMPGDVSAASWQAQMPGRCDILKLPHHGHADCMTPALLSALSPGYVVVPVSSTRSDNCPNRELMRMLQKEVPHVLFTGAVGIEGQAPGFHSSVRFYVTDRILLDPGI